MIYYMYTMEWREDSFKTARLLNETINWKREGSSEVQFWISHVWNAVKLQEEVLSRKVIHIL